MLALGSIGLGRQGQRDWNIYRSRLLGGGSVRPACASLKETGHKVAGKQWPESKKIEALRSFVILGNYVAVSREQGVPKSTVAYWVVHNPEKVKEFREEYSQACSAAYVKEIGEFKERTLPKIEKAIEAILDGMEDWRLSFASLRDKAYAVKELFVIHQLLEGEPTERLEHNIWDRMRGYIDQERAKEE